MKIAIKYINPSIKVNTTFISKEIGIDIIVIPNYVKYTMEYIIPDGLSVPLSDEYGFAYGLNFDL